LITSYFIFYFPRPSKEIEIEQESIEAGIGTIKECEYVMGEDVCGKCYCLETEKGCEIIEYSDIGDLGYAVNKIVKYEGSRENVGKICSKMCPCEIKLFSVDVIEEHTKESCEKAGGKWGIWRDTPEAQPECNLPTSDAGKECTDSSQCESYCQAPEGAEIGSKATGKCYAWKKPLTGCMQEVKEGIVQVKWCY
jgi:hypothetical protein